MSKGRIFVVALIVSLTSAISAIEKPGASAASGDSPQSLNFDASAALASRSAVTNNAPLASTPGTGTQPIILSYSTYLPLSNRAESSLIETAFSSVDSSGAACVTDGTRLWVYDAAGTPTLLVASLASVGLLRGGGAVFRDVHGNCFVVGPGVSPSPGDTVFGIARFAVAKFGPTGTRAFTTFGGDLVVR